MTEQEAIKDIRRQLAEIESEDADVTISTESLRMGIKALEKQIAKQAEYDYEDEIYICPSCGKSVGGHQKYCWNCGQRFYVD